VGAVTGEQWLAKFVVRDDDTVTLVGKTAVQNFVVDAPFSPRIAPNGRTALVLNSGGLSDGVLDDVLLVDLPTNTVIDRVAQVSDGLESLAIHPSGEFAVVSCLNAMPWSVTSHLAVIALTPDSIERRYSLPIEALPEGIEFSKSGKQLFVGSTLANHIAVYAVEGMRLERSPFVLPVGEGHAALGIGF
jgi:DNA-binding beta-propeller fold protein YncE